MFNAGWCLLSRNEVGVWRVTQASPGPYRTSLNKARPGTWGGWLVNCATCWMYLHQLHQRQFLVETALMMDIAARLVGQREEAELCPKGRGMTGNVLKVRAAFPGNVR